VTDDRQTDHATEKCIAVGEIACAEAISPRLIIINRRRALSTSLSWTPAAERKNSEGGWRSLGVKPASGYCWGRILAKALIGLWTIIRQNLH